MRYTSLPPLTPAGTDGGRRRRGWRYRAGTAAHSHRDLGRYRKRRNVQRRAEATTA